MAIFGFGSHDHDKDAERDHLKNGLIVVFGGALLAIMGFGFATGQLTIEGTFKADAIWQFFTYLAAGLFGWVMRGAAERFKNQGTATGSKTP